MTNNPLAPFSDEPSSLTMIHLVNELRRQRPGASDAGLTEVARALARPLQALYRNLPPTTTDGPPDANQTRDRMAVGRSVAQVIEESRFESRIRDAFARQSPAAAAPAGGTQSQGGRRKLVLVVDDAVDVLVTVGAFLEGVGFDVLRASDGDVALRMVANTPGIDLIVTDVAMPGMSGIDLMLQVLEVRPGMPAVVITGFADPAMLALLPASVKILHKPFRRSELTQCVHDLVSQPQQTAA